MLPDKETAIKEIKRIIATYNLNASEENALRKAIDSLKGQMVVDAVRDLLKEGKDDAES